MKLFPIIFLIIVSAAGCTSLDFFQYRDDTGLHVVERPDNYNSMQFGLELTSTNTSDRDLLVASGGEGTPTIFYETASGGNLENIEDPTRSYLAGSKDALDVIQNSSGASLVGLPIWDNNQPGCVAIGEPGAGRVAINCDPGDMVEKYIEEDGPDFGHKMAGIRPVDSGQWLLAVARENSFAVFRGLGADDRTGFYYPRNEASQEVSAITDLAAGWVSLAGDPDPRFYIAAGTYQSSTDRYQVSLFIQSQADPEELIPVACLEQPDEAGFGGSLAAGDLNGDGNDDLAVSANPQDDRVEAVYVYDVADLISNASVSYCDGNSYEPVAVVEPGEGPLNVTCTDGECFFGVSLEIGDIATDDDGQELIVGAPYAKVNGVNRAGAAYIYRGPELMEGQSPIAGQVADSTPSNSAYFGGGLTVAPMAGRNELVVGVIGKGQLFITYCTGVGTNLNAGGDVTTNENGSVISTRCRP